MNRTLIVKELKEIWWMGAVAFLLLGLLLWDAVGLRIADDSFGIVWRPGQRGRVPFLRTDFGQIAAVSACALALVVAAWQTLGESFRGTWVFLLHRPLERRKIVLIKIAAGLTITLALTGLPILLYAWWAATPGMHATPFAWWMTRETWLLWLSSIPMYLGMFFCGLRDARWYGTRFLPLAPLILLPVLIEEAVREVVPALALISLAVAVLVPSILESAKTRDYA